MRFRCPSNDCSFEESYPESPEILTRRCPLCGFEGEWHPWLSFRTMVNGTVFSETDARLGFNFAMRTECVLFRHLLGLDWLTPSMKTVMFFKDRNENRGLSYQEYLAYHSKRLGIPMEGEVWVEGTNGERVCEGRIIADGPLVVDPDYIK